MNILFIIAAVLAAVYCFAALSILLRIQKLVPHVRSGQIAGGAGERHSRGRGQTGKSKGEGIKIS